MSKKYVLIVDDDPDLVETVCMMLEDKGYEVGKAYDGVEGEEAIKERQPDLLVLDVMMPREGGIQMYRELKTDDELKEIPVIMLSAIAKKTFFHSQQVLNTYRGQKVPEPAAYIEKPPETEELLQILEQCIGC